MSRLGVISDVHGNLEALRAVLAALDQCHVDRTVCLGDVVGYNGDSNECVEAVRERGFLTIAGNHDLIALGALGFEACAMRPAFTLRRTRRELRPDSRSFLAALPRTAELCEGGVVLVHGGVDDVQQYMSTPGVIAENAARLRARHAVARICLHGHTHVPRVFEVEGEEVREHPASAVVALLRPGSLYFVNPGSVDAARRPLKMAEFAVLDTGQATVSFHHVPYDEAAAEQSARAKGYRLGPVQETFYQARHTLQRRWRGAVRRLRQARGG